MTVIDSHAEPVAPEQGAFFELETIDLQARKNGWHWPEPGLISPEQSVLLYSNQQTIGEGSLGSFEDIERMWPNILTSEDDDLSEVSVQFFRGASGEFALANVNEQTKADTKARLGVDGLSLVTLTMAKQDDALFKWVLTETDCKTHARREIELLASPDQTDIAESKVGKFDQGRIQRRLLTDSDERAGAVCDIKNVLANPCFDDALAKTRAKIQSEDPKKKKKDQSGEKKELDELALARIEEVVAKSRRTFYQAPVETAEFARGPLNSSPVSVELVEGALKLVESDIEELLANREEALLQRSNYALLGSVVVVSNVLQADLEQKPVKPFEWERHRLRAIRQRIDTLRDGPGIIGDRVRVAVSPAANYLAAALSPQTFNLGESTYRVAQCRSGIQEKQELFRIDAPGKLTAFGLAGVSFHYRDGDRVETGDVNKIAALADWQDFLKLYQDMSRAVEVSD